VIGALREGALVPGCLKQPEMTPAGELAPEAAA